MDKKPVYAKDNKKKCNFYKNCQKTALTLPAFQSHKQKLVE